MFSTFTSSTVFRLIGSEVEICPTKSCHAPDALRLWAHCSCSKKPGATTRELQYFTVITLASVIIYTLRFRKLVPITQYLLLQYLHSRLRKILKDDFMGDKSGTLYVKHTGGIIAPSKRTASKTVEGRHLHKGNAVPLVTPPRCA